jgi:hypothetical protein
MLLTRRANKFGTISYVAALRDLFPGLSKRQRPLNRLMTELTAYRTLALRNALAQDPDVAHLVARCR